MEINSIHSNVPPAQKPSENRSNKPESRSNKKVEPVEKEEESAEVSGGGLFDRSVLDAESKELLLPPETNLVAYRASFSVDDLGNTIIKIVDREGSLIRQIPPEDFLEAARVIEESFGKILDVEA